MKKYLAWKAWDNMCLPRKERGLGFKKSKEFNRTLITKLSWVVASKRECMHEVAEVQIQSEGGWLRKSKVKNVSPVWRTIEKAKKRVGGLIPYR